MEEDIKREEFIAQSENISQRNLSKTKDCNEKVIKPKQPSIKDWGSICWKCYFCSKSLNDFVNLRTHHESFHQISTWTDTYFECFDCKKVLLGYSLFLNHIRGHHYETLKLCCDVCNEVLHDYEQISIHRDKHNEICNQIHPNVYHCTLCEQVHSTEKLLKHHIQESHNLMSVDENHQISKQSHTKDEEIWYEISEYLEDGNLSLESVKCEDEYNETQETFQCGQCVQNFTNINDLKIHIRSHSVLDSNKCNFCGKIFSKRDSLRFHMRSHTVEYCKCDLCGKQFKGKHILKSHMMTHTNERPYKCNVCSKEFIKKTNLEIHTRTHDSDRPFKCDICSKEFKMKRYLEKHKQTHAERLFKCDLCPKEFTRKSLLKYHTRMHNNERPFKCDICSKAFTSNQILKIHKRTHTGERPFECEICSRAFGRKESLQRHRRICKGSRGLGKNSQDSRSSGMISMENVK